MAKLGDHAVVLGASMAGLLAARTLSDFFRRSRLWSATCCPMTPRTVGASRGAPLGLSTTAGDMRTGAMIRSAWLRFR